ncbi:MAG: Sua5 family C-terminal domain-containing protein, partial [Trueperaceae bacterium]|nr:Sua5 family C-terminal domain-containing protein [Trueperaceae bacterium]
AVRADVRPDAPRGAGDAVPRVPGALPSHYAPRAPARSGPLGAVADALAADAGAVALVRSAALPPDLAARVLRLPDDPVAYARGFYDAVRRLDAGRPSVLWIEAPPDGDAWAAIRDRVARATA